MTTGFVSLHHRRGNIIAALRKMRLEVLGFFGTPDRLLRSRVTTLIKTCRSERKAEHNQQVVTNADQLLAPSFSALSSRFATICHNYYYVFMTAACLPWARTIRLQQVHHLL
jgi:hypothetical protein